MKINKCKSCGKEYEAVSDKRFQYNISYRYYCPDCIEKQRQASYEYKITNNLNGFTKRDKNKVY